MIKIRIRLLLFLWVVGVNNVAGQSDGLLVDARDGSTYPTVEIKGTLWMLENLNYPSKLSEVLQVENDTIATGRYYHLDELDSVCPKNWRLPTLEEWLDYFQFIEESNPPLKFLYEDKLEKEDLFRIHGFEDVYYPLEPGNPLNIKNTSWFQGGKFFTDAGLQPLATFWITDLADQKINRSHIHITPSFIHIHSHKHHLKPNDQKNLRKFMVRCVKCKPD